MGRSCFGCRENISTGQIISFCSYGEMFSRLPGKVSRCDLDFVECKQKVFPLSGKVVFIWDQNYLGHRDLACQQARSRYPGKLSSHINAKKLFILFHIKARSRLWTCRNVFSGTEITSAHMNRPLECWLTFFHTSTLGNYWNYGSKSITNLV